MAAFEDHAAHQLLFPWGTLTYYDSGGVGRPLVFLHGTGCSSRDFHSIILSLTSTNEAIRCLALDFRAHGKSSTPSHCFSIGDLAGDVLDFLQRLKLSRSVLVGHSLGGMVAQAVAGSSDRVRGVVLLEGWVNLSASAHFDGHHHQFGGLSPDSISDIKRDAAALHTRLTLEIFNSFWNTVVAWDGTRALQETEIPIWHLYGSAGQLPMTENGLGIPSNPLSEFHWIPGCGHYLPQECPHRIVALIQDFLTLNEKRGRTPLRESGPLY